MLNKYFLSIFKGKKILVTGHTGFKGSWLSLWLHELGADVVGFSLPPLTEPNNYDRCNLNERITSIIGDLRKFDCTSKVIAEQKPEIIFHLAAQTIVRLSYQESRMTYETNIMGLVNLLEAVKLHKSPKIIVIVTSDKCYENKEWVWAYRETDEIGGYDPYSSSKACAEIIASTYRRSFFDKLKIHLATARAGNVIGGGDWSEDRIVPDCIRAIIKNEKILIRNPSATRPWQYILEPLSGYLWLAALLYQNGAKYASAWNFGPPTYQEETVENIVKLSISYWKGTFSSKYQTNKNNDEPHESHNLRLDCNKAYHLLNWKGILDVRNSVKKTINWYKKFYQGEKDIYHLCLNEIVEYCKLAQKSGIQWANASGEQHCK